jgi:hypothetical protein
MLGASLHLCYADMGGLPAGEYLDMVELIGTEIAPTLAAVDAGSAPAPASASAQG